MPQLLERGLYGIAGPASAGPFARRREETLALAQAFAAAGAPVVQLRDKVATGRELVALARELRALLPSSTLLVVNDRLDVALAAGADGVHLGQDDLPVDVARDVLARCGRRLLVGVSAHDAAEVRAAVDAGVDYVGFGPVFPTKTKADALSARGLDALAAAVGAARGVPVVAIGGIGLENCDDVVRAGASLAAVISDVRSAVEPALRARLLHEKIAAPLG